MTIKLEMWEGSDFVIVINGRPTGPTVTKQTGDTVVAWLKDAKTELQTNLNLA